MIGENIRQARLAQDWSLADVAKKAKISVATLSRIETDKQTLELGLFLTLARILDRTPQDLLGSDGAPEGNRVDPLVKKVEALLVQIDRVRDELASVGKRLRGSR